MTVSPEVLERAKKIMAAKNGHIPIEIKSTEVGVPVEVDHNINTEFVPLQAATDQSKPAKFTLPQTGMEYDASKDKSAPKKTAIKTELGKTETIDNINIWQDKPTGKCGISIGEAIYQIPPPIFDLFTRMVSTQRGLVSDLETERFNNKKLKQGMV